MKAPDDGQLLRIFIGESDYYEDKPLYEWIILKARELNLAGATVTRGIMGYGANSRIHTAKILRLSTDLPIIVEIVDREQNLNKIMPYIDKAVKEGLITMETVRVIKYRNIDDPLKKITGL